MNKGTKSLPLAIQNKKGIRVRGEALPQYVHETARAISNLSRDLGETAATKESSYAKRSKTSFPFKAKIS
jgi:hypothetical protein